MVKDWITKTRQLAELSDFHKAGRRTGCIIIKKGKVISEGFNKMKNRFSVSNRRGHTVHAEIDAINKINGMSLKGCRAYVFRQKGGVSRPCSMCLYALESKGIHSIIYENEYEDICRFISCRYAGMSVGEEVIKRHD